MASVPHARVGIFWMKECGKATLRLVKRNICILKNHSVINEFQNNEVFSRLRTCPASGSKWWWSWTLLKSMYNSFSCEGLHCARLLQCVLLFLDIYALHNAIAIGITGFNQLILFELKRSIFQLSDWRLNSKAGSKSFQITYLWQCLICEVREVAWERHLSFFWLQLLWHFCSWEHLFPKS